MNNMNSRVKTLGARVAYHDHGPARYIRPNYIQLRGAGALTITF